jgi:phosphate:Na+ symporter
MTASPLELALTAAGGLALFMLAMSMLTDGLKSAGGGSLKRLLERWTSTPARGVAAGALVTALVQFSGAVTVAAIGFVNAGVLTLRQALGVIYGTNVGTTLTAWLVSLVGFGLRIEAFALPTIAVGVSLRLAAPGRRLQGIGNAIAGLGLFFLGLSILRDAFGAVAQGYGATLAPEAGWPMYLLVGFVATVLTQSSSAAIAIILTAAAGGLVGLESAAAAVIGANIGTTSTAAVAALKATPSAKRLAAGHVAFNVVTGVVALLLLPVLLWAVGLAARWLDVEGSPAAFLALFHTAFNLLGVALMLPLTGRLAAVLERMFRSAEEDLARPQHLDATLTTTPALAVGALHEELARLRRLVASLALSAVTEPAAAGPPTERRAAAIRSLTAAAFEFVSAVRGQSMTREVADELARSLRIARYLDEAARLAPEVAALRAHPAWAMLPATERDAVAPLWEHAIQCVALAARAADAEDHDAERQAALQRFEHAYERAKSTLLTAAVARRFDVETADALLDHLSLTRRAVQQLVKADRLLRTPARAAQIEGEDHDTAAAAGAGAQ